MFSSVFRLWYDCLRQSLELLIRRAEHQPHRRRSCVPHLYLFESVILTPPKRKTHPNGWVSFWWSRRNLNRTQLSIQAIILTPIWTNTPLKYYRCSLGYDISSKLLINCCIQVIPGQLLTSFAKLFIHPVG